MKVIVFDTETTGLIKHSQVPLAQQPRVIELGFILWDLTPTKGRQKKTGTIQEYSYLFNPGMKLEAIITKITGLTDADLKDKPTFADTANEVASHFAKADVAVAHNVEFDQKMVGMECARCAFPKFPWPKTLMCTVRQYEYAFGHRPTLQQLYQHVLGKPLAQTHRALDDCRALLDILLHDRANLFPDTKEVSSWTHRVKTT